MVLVAATVTTVSAGPSAAAPAGDSAASGFDANLSFVVGTDPASPVTTAVGSVLAPPNDSANLIGPDTTISFDAGGTTGVLPIASAGSISSTAVSSASDAAAKADVSGPEITVAGDVLGFTQANSSVDCPVGGNATASISTPTSYTLNGTPFDLDLDGETLVTLATGTVLIATPPVTLTETTADAVALILTITVTTADYTESGTVSVASSSCRTPAAPTLDSLGPAFGPASGGTLVTVTGSGFYPNETTVNIGPGQGLNVSVSPDGKSLTFNTPGGNAGTVQVSISTKAGTSKELPFEYRAPITTSGILRDADTGGPLRDGCVVWSESGSPGTNGIAWVNGDGTWSFESTSPGPFDIGFYARSDNDCNNAIGTSYVPSWYLGKPMTGTDPMKVTPAEGATPVAAGSTTVACLSRTSLAVTCAEPVTLSGRVTVLGGSPAPYTCVFVLGQSGDGQLSVADANGNWSASGLPNDIEFIVGFIAAFGPPDKPCDFNGPPPTPPAGALQPVFYRNVWVDLATLTADNSQINAYDWAIEHGAELVPGNSVNIDACLSTVAGSVVPRPDCLNPPTTTPSAPTTPTSADPATTPTTTTTSTVTAAPVTTTVSGVAVVVVARTQSLAATGVPVAPIVWTGLVLVAIGLLLLRASRRHRQQLH